MHLDDCISEGGSMGTRVMDEKELQVLAEQVLNEIPSKRNDDVRAIQDWIRKQPHLREYGRSGEYGQRARVVD